MNKFLHLGISTFIWIYLTRGVIKNEGFFGTLIHKIGINIFPKGLFNLSGPIIILLIFALIYAFLFYFAVWKDHPEKED